MKFLLIALLVQSFTQIDVFEIEGRTFAAQWSEDYDIVCNAQFPFGDERVVACYYASFPIRVNLEGDCGRELHQRNEDFAQLEGHSEVWTDRRTFRTMVRAFEACEASEDDATPP